ncbi:EcsC family protein [Niallia sp. NCCP-28]|uniref:EcsC family protein n=1 Tax=Niallia sp. NCCP-28 TaxID=2934712 RepID=UPI002082F481|nr:EcsC family protein [Niallia sp. NCCP-28]GKU81699.1 ABC transporter-associated protein EcsC [Niallia sp. NCCP-28]
MEEYEKLVYIELAEWKRKLRKRSSMITRFSKKTQNKINAYIPSKAQRAVTEAIKQMIQTTLKGSNRLTKKAQSENITLEEKDELMMKKINFYRKTASVEGASTGAGGILLGLADFPILLSIKMQFLMEAASLYGYDTELYEERVFLLYIFQLAFSSDEKRADLLEIIENWEEYKKEKTELNWEQLQMEYRDYIDFVKMLQLVPGIGAFVGAYANYNLLDQLGETAKNVYRIRYLQTAAK